MIKIIVIAFLVVFVIFGFSLMKVSSRCSRWEEMEERKRWEELKKNMESQSADR